MMNGTKRRQTSSAGSSVTPRGRAGPRSVRILDQPEVRRLQKKCHKKRFYLFVTVKLKPLEISNTVIVAKMRHSNSIN